MVIKIAFCFLLGFFSLILNVFEDLEEQFQSSVCFDPLVSGEASSDCAGMACVMGALFEFSEPCAPNSGLE